MTDKGNERIAVLTSGAIRASGQAVATEIMNAVDAAEEAVKQLREDAEYLITEIRSHTDEFADRVNSFVAECHVTSELFRNRKETIANPPREIPLLLEEKDLLEKRA